MAVLDGRMEHVRTDGPSQKMLAANLNFHLIFQGPWALSTLRRFGNIIGKKEGISLDESDSSLVIIRRANNEGWSDVREGRMDI